MNQADLERIEEFLERWQDSSGNERANYQLFFSELCDALGVQRPADKGRFVGDPCCFDKDVKIFHPSGKVTPGFIDFYKADHFLIEAKQGGVTSGKGTAKRGTATYLKEMEKAFVQATAYTRNLEAKPPFLLTCDIGDHFELWMGFSGDYGGYGARREILLAHLLKPEVFDFFVDIFTNPQKRNPEKIAAQVTREVAADLAELARRMEKHHDPQRVAHFLMRCIFTMFAEDVGLLKEKIFTAALQERWLAMPKSFKPEVEALWQAMKGGTPFGFSGKLLKFNGGLFAEAIAFELTAEQLTVLLQAAKKDWKNVEPAIFGTLLERALDPKERSKLGAHYTPRSYVERLVRPVVMEPLREQWDLVQLEVKQLLDNGDQEPTENQKKKAKTALEDFLKELRETKILDPACGSGNFLYVTLDLLKGLESEVLRRLEDVTGQSQLKLDFDQVNPSQFVGIELNPRAAAIADLVIWIGYLQWHFRRFGEISPVEPVLREYKNIECRDAVLAYDGREPAINPATNQPRTRWGGRITKHPVTGEDIPDPTDQIPIYRYLNPRPAEWPDADYIVSNPPFIGNARMRETLGDGYTETLRQTYRDVPETVDYVMYWWHKAAEVIRSEKVEKFGFITTNTIRQVWQRAVIDFHLGQKNPVRLIFAIPDHPWTDDGAAVRIAMTASELGDLRTLRIAQLGNIVVEGEGETPEDASDQVEVKWRSVGRIFSDLRSGANISSTIKLQSNTLLAGRGICLHGAGFLVNGQDMEAWGNDYLDSVIKPCFNGKDLVGSSRQLFVIDFFGLSESEAAMYERPFQKVLEEVKPERDVNERKGRRDNWWLFGETMPKTRNSIRDLNRYVTTPETSKHRVFQYLDSSVLPDNKIVVIALEDAYFLGILSGKAHVTWALACGSQLGPTPVYPKSICFDPFPFPDPTPEQKQKVRDLGERLDAHRKRVQVQHPDVTITGMYNLLEKMRTGEPLTDKDREYNNKALVSTLKQIHDELDAAVFEAYGWPPTLSVDEILERLVALNAERAEEERNGFVRWLRPEYQAPHETQTQQVIAGVDAETDIVSIIAPAEQQSWPKQFKDRLAAIRDLLRTSGSEWTVEQVAAQFKGAQRQKRAIANCLESLEELGILTSHAEDGTIRRWYFAELQKVS